MSKIHLTLKNLETLFWFRILLRNVVLSNFELIFDSLIEKQYFNNDTSKKLRPWTMGFGRRF